MNVPSAGEVQAAVWAVIRDTEKLGCWDEHTDSIDVRLQVTADSWRILWGDPSFDTDHNGVWGMSTIDKGARTFADAGVIACELVSQVEDEQLTEEP